MKKGIIFLLASAIAFAGGSRAGRLTVSVVVQPAARLQVQSANAVTAGVVIYPNTHVLVWAASGTCGAPDNPKIIAASGFHNLIFSPEEVAGKDRVCLTSSDGILNTAARLPQ
jgi:hypothetical protein